MLPQRYFNIFYFMLPVTLAVSYSACMVEIHIHLSLAQYYYLLSRDTLVHKLHDKQLQVFTNFVACFVNPEHLPPIPRTLVGLEFKGDKLLPARDMYVGRV